MCICPTTDQLTRNERPQQAVRLRRRCGYAQFTASVAAVLTLTFAVPCAGAEAQSPEAATLAAVQQFLGNMGETAALERLAQVKVRFGPTTDGVNAECDMYGNQGIVINTGASARILTAHGVHYANTAGLAASIMHELVHSRQDAVKWSKSVASDLFGYRHTAEKEAWGEGFQSYKRWMDRLARDPGYAQRRLPAAQRAEIARQIIDLCDGWIGYRDDYSVFQRRWGVLIATDKEGVPIPLDEMSQEILAIRSAAQDVLAQAQAISGPAVLSPRTEVKYVGRFRGEANGDISFKLNAGLVDAGGNGIGQLPGVGLDTFRLSLNRSPASQNHINYTSGEVEFRMTGAWSSMNAAHKSYSASRAVGTAIAVLAPWTFHGRITGDTASGTWSWRKLKGTWECQRMHIGP